MAIPICGPSSSNTPLATPGNSPQSQGGVRTRPPSTQNTELPVASTNSPPGLSSNAAVTLRLDLGSKVPIATTSMGRALLAARGFRVERVKLAR